MNETQLISIRVPVKLLSQIDAEVQKLHPITRSGIIVNLLQAVFDASDPGTRFLMETWPLRKKKHYELQLNYDPNCTNDSILSNTNLITP